MYLHWGDIYPLIFSFQASGRLCIPSVKLLHWKRFNLIDPKICLKLSGFNPLEKGFYRLDLLIDIPIFQFSSWNIEPRWKQPRRFLTPQRSTSSCLTDILLYHTSLSLSPPFPFVPVLKQIPSLSCERKAPQTGGGVGAALKKHTPTSYWPLLCSLPHNALMCLLTDTVVSMSPECQQD